MTEWSHNCLWLPMAECCYKRWLFSVNSEARTNNSGLLWSGEKLSLKYRQAQTVKLRSRSGSKIWVCFGLAHCRCKGHPDQRMVNLDLHFCKDQGCLYAAENWTPCTLWHCAELGWGGEGCIHKWKVCNSLILGLIPKMLSPSGGLLEHSSTLATLSPQKCLQRIPYANILDGMTQDLALWALHHQGDPYVDTTRTQQMPQRGPDLILDFPEHWKRL